MKIRDKRRAGFTLIEALISACCGSIILAALLTSGVALQRSFAAVEGYSASESDQLRILDYIAMDCRRAVSAAVNNNILTVTLPNYYNGSRQPTDPVLVNDVIQYSAGTTTISYSQSGSDFIRTVTTGGTTLTTTIATNIATFTVTPLDLTSSVSCQITFAPRFTNMPGPGPVAGTTVYCNTFFRNASARQ